MPDRFDCIRCGTDCHGDDDYPGFHVGDVAICFEPDEGYLAYIHLCERCKQGLDTVVERYLKNESTRYMGHPVGGRPAEPPPDAKRGINGHAETVHDEQRGERQ